MSNHQNITSCHRSPKRERDGYVLTLTSLQKRKTCPLFPFTEKRMRAMKTRKTTLYQGFISFSILLLLIGTISCVKRFPRLETEPNPKNLEGTWTNDKASSIQNVRGDFTIVLLPNNAAHVINFPTVTPPKMEHDIRFINGESKWEIWKRNTNWGILLDVPNLNERRVIYLYLERDSNEILLTYYISPNWPAGIVFRKKKKEPIFSSCSSEQTNNMNNPNN